MVDTLLPALEHEPERFHTIRVNVATHTLLFGLLNRIVLIRQSLLGAGIVSVNRHIRRCTFTDETLESHAVCLFNCLGADFFALPILRAHNGSFANGSAARALQRLALATLIWAIMYMNRK